MILETIKDHLLPAESILEIGPGRGSITEGLSGLGKPLFAVEKDKKYVERMAEKFEQITVIEADAADFDLSTLDQKMLPAMIAGNLPYYAATDIILNLLSVPSGISSAHFMVQHEVAMKFSSDAGDEFYSKYGIWAKTFYEVKYDFKVSRKAFKPPPKVLSAFMTFKPLIDPLIDEANSREFYRFCSRLFLHPRKKFISNLDGESKAVAESLMNQRGIREDERPANIPMQIFVELFRQIGEKKWET
jgi:16S rRNA (adenine1518-N6/adenine1519-N6)-dimethyltransferase